MFRRIRRLFELWKKSLFDSYDHRPTVYKFKGKRYIRVKRLRTQSKTKGPYIK